MQIQFLGQAGLLVEVPGFRVVIDPYLSDSVAVTFGAQNTRQVPVAIAPDALPPLGKVLLTHAHLDHTDPETLRPLAGSQPGLGFVAPYESRDLLREWGIAPSAMIPPPLEWTPLGGGLEMRAVPAAHLALERNAQGELRYVGYLLRAGGVTLYHAGDTIPHPEIFESLAGERIDVALLPVNERNFYREHADIVGNLTLREAFRMAADLAVHTLVPLHWDMFAGNRVHPEEMEVLHRLEAPPFSLEVLHAGAVKLLSAR